MRALWLLTLCLGCQLVAKIDPATGGPAGADGGQPGGAGTGGAGTGGAGTGGAGTGGAGAGGESAGAGAGGDGFTVAWALRYGSSEVDVGSAIALDGQGDVIVGGLHTGQIRFDDRTWTAQGYDAYIAKLDERGTTTRWSTQFGEEGLEWVAGIAVGPGGTLAVTGAFNKIDFHDGQGAHVAAGNLGYDGYVARLDPQGRLLWGRVFGAPGVENPNGSLGDDQPQAVAVQGSQGEDPGAVYVTGIHDGVLTIGNTVDTGGVRNAFIAKFGSDGTPRWVRSFGGHTFNAGLGAATDPAGNVYVTGTVSGPVDFGDGTGVDPQQGGADLFVMKLDPTGVAKWHVRAGVQNREAEGRGILLRNEDELYVAGKFGGTLYLGRLPPIEAASDQDDGFVARFTLAGDEQWMSRVGGAAEDTLNSIASGGASHVVAAGTFAGELTAGSSLLRSVGGNDILLTRFESDTGRVVDGLGFGGILDDGGFAHQGAVIITGFGGALYVTGNFSERMVVGSIPLQAELFPPQSHPDIFVTRIDVR